MAGPLGPEAYSVPLSRLLVASYVAPDFPMKLRLLGILERCVGRRRIIRRTAPGFLMALDQQEFIQSRILYQGQWEQELTILLSRELRAGDVFYDIGANVGYFSCLAAYCGVTEIVAFEPDPLVCAILRGNLALNGFDSPVLVCQRALSDTAGSVLFQRGSDSAFSGFGDWQMRHVAEVVEVDATTLDAFVLSGGGPVPTVLKIDVEGWEERVLAGSNGLLAAYPPRLIVFEAPASETGQLNAPRLHNFFLDHGYEIAHLRRTDGTIGTVENYTASRKGR
jgi:FkbM family methyltransferase